MTGWSGEGPDNGGRGQMRAEGEGEGWQRAGVCMCAFGGVSLFFYSQQMERGK